MDFYLYFNMFYSSIFTEKDHLHDFSCYTKVIIGSKKKKHQITVKNQQQKLSVL